MSMREKCSEILKNKIPLIQNRHVSECDMEFRTLLSVYIAVKHFILQSNRIGFISAIR